MMDPMSKDLHMYLSRLEEQQRQVRSCWCTQSSHAKLVHQPGHRV